jgi:uncharacterized membrane protein
MNLKLILHQSFEAGVILKGIDGLLEIIGGALLLLVSPGTINRMIISLTQHELSEDPNDLLANYLINFAHNFSISTQLFGVIYLLSHGIIKIFLVVSLLKGKIWAFPTAIAFFTIFIIYQTYRYFLNYSVGLFFLTIFDILIVVLTWLEYRRHLIKVGD